MINNNSFRVLNYLVRTGIWSRVDKLSIIKHLILDVDSIVVYLYRYCINKHVQRQKSILKNQQANLYEITLINYVEFCEYIEQLFNYFDEHNIEPILVYEGKLMEAPLFGLIPSQFDSNVKIVNNLIGLNNYYDKNVTKLNNIQSNNFSNYYIDNHLAAPNLAFNIFKFIIKNRQKVRLTTKNKIEPYKVYQAYYSSYPVLAKLARDFKCPVITNNAEFILMDVRAGFILFDSFWPDYIESKRNTNSIIAAKDKTPIKSPLVDGSSKIKLHFNYLFTQQHPGLNAPLSLNYFPLTISEFMIKYYSSLKKMKIFDNQLNIKDLKKLSQTISHNHIIHSNSDDNKRLAYENHHLSANIIDMVTNFLCGKSMRSIGNFIRSEAVLSKTNLDEDFRELFNYYSVSFDFKTRLRFILKYTDNNTELKYINWCLTSRECTADFLLDLLTCSLGRLASVNYNRFMQLEDTSTLNSTHSLLNNVKKTLMSLFSSNKVYNSDCSISFSKQESNNLTRYSTASLTTVDRSKSKLIEYTLETTHDNSKFDLVKKRLSFDIISSRKVNKTDSIEFINSIFNTKNLVEIYDKKIINLCNKFALNSHKKQELAIILNLFDFSYNVASKNDNHFSETYAKLKNHFQIAIANLYLCHIEKKHNDLFNLNQLIIKHNLSLLVNNKIVTDMKEGYLDISKQIKHLIELLNKTIEAYFELNAFFEYPFPELNIHHYYNPVLLYNFTFLSYNNNKALIKF